MFLIIFLFTINLSAQNKIIQSKYSLSLGAYSLTVSINNVSSIKALNESSLYLIRSGPITSENFITTASFVDADGKGFIASLVEDTISTDNFSVPLLHDIITESKWSIFADNSIPLAHRFPDEAFSIVHQLYKQNDISHLAFGFSKYMTYRGYLYFSGLPKEEKESQYEAKCKVKSDDYYWGCDLEYVYFGDRKYDMYINANYSKFSTNHFNILAPVSFLTYMKNTVFKEMIERRKCMFMNTNMYHFFHCDCDTIDKFPDLHFVFEGKVFTVKMVNLFEIYDPSALGVEYCEFLISKNNINENEWSFGAIFLQNYAINFDYETNDVTFYSIRPFKSFNVDCSWYIVNIILLSIGIIYNLYINRYKN